MKKFKKKYSLSIAIILLLLAFVVLTSCSSKSDLNSQLTLEPITLYKTPTCGCCGVYSQYLSNQGFNVNVQQLEQLTAIKQQYNIPTALQSCHTSIMGNYFVEGHIPQQAIEKLLTEKPNIAGIAMPGMPSGSPGMPGSKDETWIIYAVGNDGSISEFMRI